MPGDKIEASIILLSFLKEEEEQQGKNVHIYINVSTGSKVSSIAGTLACMIWKGTPYYAHIDYNDTGRK
jgi:CRISPR/Cas system-associated protein Csm6